MDETHDQLVHSDVAGNVEKPARPRVVLQPVLDEFFRPGHYFEIPLVLLHDRVVGRLSDSVASAIGLQSQVRDVRVGAETQRHIFEQRQVACVDDVMACLNRLDEAFSHLTYLIAGASNPSVFEIIGAMPTTGRFLHVPIKLVSAVNAKSGCDELWLRTAIPSGTQTLRRLLQQGRLRALPPVAGGLGTVSKS